MVDSTKGIGSVSHINQTNKTQNESREREIKREERAERNERTSPRDKVTLSREALDRAAAEKAAQEARKALSEDQDLTLGLDPDFDSDES